MDASTVLRLTGAIYDAPLIGDWRPALDLIHDEIDCTHVVLMTHDTKIGRQSPIGGRDRGIEVKYVEHYAPLNEAWPALARQEIGAAVLDRHTLDMQRWERSVFYNEFARANGMVSSSGVVFQRERGVISGLALHHGERTAEFERRDLEMLSAVSPHFQRAHLLWQGKPALATGDLSLWQAVDRLSTGVVIIDHVGKILRANDIASNLLRLRSSAMLQRSPYPGPDMLQSTILHALLCSIAPGDSRRSAGMYRLQSDERDYMLTILPLQGPPDWVDTHRTCYALLIADMAAAPVDARHYLVAGFGLTKAEAGLAVRLGDGALGEIATSLGIRLSTAKTLLGRALGKTQTHSQAQLVRLVERLAQIRTTP